MEIISNISHHSNSTSIFQLAFHILKRGGFLFYIQKITNVYLIDIIQGLENNTSVPTKVIV